MSLLDEAMYDCVMLDKRTESDGYGGNIVSYVEGAMFKAAITFNSSIQAKIAEKQGVTNLYSVTVSKRMNLSYNDIFKRNNDNKIFRITSDGYDNKTPDSASIDMKVFSAETITLPT